MSRWDNAYIYIYIYMSGWDSIYIMSGWDSIYIYMSGRDSMGQCIHIYLYEWAGQYI